MGGTWRLEVLGEGPGPCAARVVLMLVVGSSGAAPLLSGSRCPGLLALVIFLLLAVFPGLRCSGCLVDVSVGVSFAHLPYSVSCCGLYLTVSLRRDGMVVVGFPLGSLTSPAFGCCWLGLEYQT